MGQAVDRRPESDPLDGAAEEEALSDHREQSTPRGFD
jgi:hypothetical protein